MESTRPFNLNEIDEEPPHPEQSFGEYLTEDDTDTENCTLPPSRRYVWYCKHSECPNYYSAWALKTNFLLHLYETQVHIDDPRTSTKEGRHRLARSWREETAFDPSEPKKEPPKDTGTEETVFDLDGPEKQAPQDAGGKEAAVDLSDPGKKTS